jgi:hypothetical protein
MKLTLLDLFILISLGSLEPPGKKLILLKILKNIEIVKFVLGI